MKKLLEIAYKINYTYILVLILMSIVLLATQLIGSYFIMVSYNFPILIIILLLLFLLLIISKLKKKQEGINLNINEISEFREEEFTKYSQKNILTFHCNQLIAVLKDNDMIILNGNYGIGKTTIIKSLKLRFKPEQLTHVELWNLDYTIDKTSFLFHSIISTSKINFMLSLFLIMNIFSDYIHYIPILKVLLILVVLYINKAQFVIIFSKINVIPISLISSFLWNAVEKREKIYIFEDIDRLDIKDQIQVFEFCSELNKYRPNSKIIISLAVSNLEGKAAESLHKLKAKRINVSYDLELQSQSNYEDKTGKCISESDIIFSRLIWSGIKHSKHFKIEPDFRFTSYYANELGWYIADNLSYTDSIIASIFEYYYGISSVDSSKLINNSTINDKINLLLFHDYNLINRRGFVDVFYTHAIESIGYYSKNQMFDIPIVFKKYVRYTNKELGEENFYPRYHTVNKILSEFESDELVSILKKINQQEIKNFNDLIDYDIYDYLFQDIVLNALESSNYQISTDVQKLRDKASNKYFEVDELNMKNASKIIGRAIQSIFEFGKFEINVSNFEHRSVEVNYNDNLLPETSDANELWKLLRCKEITNGSTDNEVSDIIIKGVYSNILTNTMSNRLAIYQLAVIILIKPSLKEYVSNDNPVLKVVNIFKQEISKDNQSQLHLFFPDNIGDIEFLINKCFSYDNLRYKCKVEYND